MSAPQLRRCERETCMHCGAKMPTYTTDLRGKLSSRSSSIGRMDPRGLFCTLRCAAQYGVRLAGMVLGEKP